jgi:signal transduction histidine kinase
VGLAGFFPEWLASFDLVIRPTWPLTTAAVLAVLNAIWMHLAASGPEGRTRIPVSVQLWLQVVTDLALLIAVVHWMGIGLPAAPFMFLFHIILACMVFPPRESMFVLILAAGLYLTLLLAEYLGIVARHSVVVSEQLPNAEVPGTPFLAYNVGFTLLIWSVIWYLVSKVTGALRRREEELAWTNRRLEASSEERAQHMLQTTHHLKAPFAAVHAQTQLLLGGFCGDLPEAAKLVAQKISARCHALSVQIQSMLQLANLSSQGQVSPAKTAVNLKTLIDVAIQRVNPAADQRGITFDLEAEPVAVCAVEDHLRMLLEELVANAVEYSYDQGQVRIECRAQDVSSVCVQVRDHGIGIPPDKLPRIFEDYYRTEEAVGHKRTSTGLGLAIVRRVARQSGVQLEVRSAPGWGTEFTVTLPGRCDPPPTHQN